MTAVAGRSLSMATEKCTGCLIRGEAKTPKPASLQRILVFQQNGSGESKIRGIRQYGKDLFIIETISIDESLPTVLDDTAEYLPSDIQADLVLDFLKHPDLSHDLAAACARRKIPVVASGKKLRGKRVFVPPT
jgi:hypothetical protein